MTPHLVVIVIVIYLEWKIKTDRRCVGSPAAGRPRSARSPTASTTTTMCKEQLASSAARTARRRRPPVGPPEANSLQDWLNIYGFYLVYLHKSKECVERSEDGPPQATPGRAAGGSQEAQAAQDCLWGGFASSPGIGRVPKLPQPVLLCRMPLKTHALVVAKQDKSHEAVGADAELQRPSPAEPVAHFCRWFL
ncbi:hypothetical protein AAL_04664 [Moelleriella libera RCEF 2490]|uniref:Uncharacterized protein n=1 Tax=Moelleriella libera RCEF 2490 TaxID=1081109 RepID=A0A162IM83_9HYPO|nr:hypothetical protein AAL_04664 [Moelleriella libera RCEF 2490]